MNTMRNQWALEWAKWEKKDKQQLLYELIQYRNNLLSGRLNENSNIIGEITSGAPDKSKQKTRIDKITLTKTGGDPNGPPVGIPIGDGTRGRGGERFGGKGGEKPGINEGGDHSIITTKGNSRRQVEGPITPEIKQIPYPFGLDKPMAYLPDTATFNWNTSWPQTIKAHNAEGKDWVYLVAPVYGQAIVNFDNQNEDLTAKEWQGKYAEYMKFMIDRVEKAWKQ